ncbi:protein transport protein Sec16B [Dendroctonus ponderosae]|uniref:protein transport protein Sec16B n=1 Tax=Dendroctonus ponderosae TaxID=77166 RepID=UPI002035B620|nr:protein transport protein Sec16B [Dendroctonus ponderosae]
MSWAQRRGPTRPNNTTPNPPTDSYHPIQHSNDPQWQSSATQGWQQPASQPPTAFQAIQRQHWSQTNAASNEASIPENTGQYQLLQPSNQSAYYQTTGAGYNQQQAYGNVQYSQQMDQNNLYAAQQSSNDWGNWGWGDDDNSNAPATGSTQPQILSNQMMIADSFTATDESWNWTSLDSTQQKSVDDNCKQQAQPLFPTIGDLKSKCEVGNRKKLETPQWSTESQPSLESSDDVLQTSESDKSHLMSRSSTISHSPISGQELLPSILQLPSQPEEFGATNQQQLENKENLKQVVTENKRVNSTPPLPISGNAPPLLLPPQGPSDASRNPYKRTVGLPHQNAASFKSEIKQPTPIPTFNQPVNLETIPDNSEHPDQPLVTGKSNPNWPQTDNNEAPINDRNQYLETGQLSEMNSADIQEAVDPGNDTLPPPGLQRMIPGQLEQKEIGGRADQLPGFSRMVLGQNGNASNISNQVTPRFDLRQGPPEGLHRMVPGESSSPETSLRRQNVEENDSERELVHEVQPPRSATIGADTPPIQTQMILSPLSVSPNLVVDHPDLPQGPLPNESKLMKSVKLANEKIDQSESRRETTDGEVAGLTRAVRNLTVGENLTDGTSNNSQPELSPRRQSRQESSESESDRKNARSHRDRRSAEKLKSRDKDRERYKERDIDRDRGRERNSDRFSPDPYRDKRDGRGRRYRDRRYEDETDYYSDKDRKLRDDRERDYEKKYSSLRKDKERRRKDRDPREIREASRRVDYYYYDRASRPSSRDSMHESYRERRHEPDSRDRRPPRDRYRSRDHKDQYNPYQSFAYDPYNPYYQQYQYYENLRRTNPQAYAEWYRKYYQQATGSTASFAGEDRASVHSGRSSANEEVGKDRYMRQSFYSQSNYYGQSHSISGHYGLDDTSNTFNRVLDQTDTSLACEDQPSAIQRLTPTKFSTAHLKASIASGNLIKILPHYPMDGQSAVVHVSSLRTLVESDPNYMELSCFPGPLSKGVTHKKQIIEYCESKIKGAYSRNIIDIESYVLLWELLILLIRQNGMVVGTDIAELLLKDRVGGLAPRPASALSTSSSNVLEKNEISAVVNQPASENGSTQSVLKEEEVTRRFREYLLYGSCQEALEWAMKHGLWGHALFLASKLDKRTYANVMMHFANGLRINDPLQTLYQLLSGKLPAVVTCASDEKWGDWRPHLAMILSNSTQRPELNCKAITQLGDTLLNIGSLYAAQFCYLMAEVGFGRHGDSTSRLVLLGSDHRNPYPQFVTNEAIHMTEIYEFACSLNDQDFHISQFQLYKFILATRLADVGLLQKSLQYLERLAVRIIYNPVGAPPGLVDSVCTLADRLKFYDPVGDIEDESSFGDALDTSRPDNSWLKDLRAVLNDNQPSKPKEDEHPDFHLTQHPLEQPNFDQSHDVWQQEQQQYDQQQQQQFDQQQRHYKESSVWSTELQSHSNQGYQVHDKQQLQNVQHPYQDQSKFWAGQAAQAWVDPTAAYGQETNHSDQVTQPDQLSFFATSNNKAELKVEKEAAEGLPQLQTSLPNQAKDKVAYDQEPLAHEKHTSLSKAPSKSANQTTGWFGGIFSKLSMKPKNQMKLPDDKNPKIVWDENKKRWTNVDADPNETANEFKPPPKMLQFQSVGGSGMDSASTSSLGFSSVDRASFTPSGPTSLPLLGAAVKEDVPTSNPSLSNMFKMQKRRNLKNSYVDVFKQNEAKTNKEQAPLVALEQVPLVAPTQINFFVPQAISDANAPVDFLTPGGVLAPIGDQQNK